MSSERESSGPTDPAEAQLSRAQRTAVLKALADSNRFELLERIARSSCPLGCSEMRDALSISAATLSHHVKELETAGLIESHRDGKFVRLTLRPGVLQALISMLSSLRNSACPGQEE